MNSRTVSFSTSTIRSPPICRTRAAGYGPAAHHSRARRLTVDRGRPPGSGAIPACMPGVPHTTTHGGLCMTTLRLFGAFALAGLVGACAPETETDEFETEPATETPAPVP